MKKSTITDHAEAALIRNPSVVVLVVSTDEDLNLVSAAVGALPILGDETAVYDVLCDLAKRLRENQHVVHHVIKSADFFYFQNFEQMFHNRYAVLESL